MNPLNKYSFILFLLLLTGYCCKAGNAFDSANAAYTGRNYQEALRYYEKIAGQGLEAPELDYNMGNTYLKMKNAPKAILHFERALRQRPDDEDIRFNLRIANNLITDKTEDKPEHMLETWKNHLFNLLSEKNWALAGIACFVTGLALMLIYIISARVRIRQLALGLSACILIICAGLSFIAWRKARAEDRHTEAVVMSPNVTAKGSPDEKGTDLFILHEGTKVILLQKNGNWTEIKLMNGTTGWLPDSVFEII
ncbi:MAG: tetratricopeptide repeat protein [Bacteroidia bacterium]